MAEQLNTASTSQEIPNTAHLYMRVHRTNLSDDGSIKPGAFRNHADPETPDAEPGMSAYWDKYATPQAVLKRARDPKENVVIEMNVGKVREIPYQRVAHTPTDEPEIGCAHTDVFGPKDTKDPEVRKMFLNISSPVLRP